MASLQNAVLVLCIAYVALVMLVRAKRIRLRLERAGRLYDAGRVQAGDKVMAAVGRDIISFRRKHPGWGQPARREVC